MLVAEREEVGTFPHVACVHGVGRRLSAGSGFTNWMEVSPLTEIGRRIKKDGATFAANARTYDQHPAVGFAPEAWIAESSDFKTGRRSCDDRLRELFPGTQVFIRGNGEALRFLPGVDSVLERRIGLGLGRLHSGVDHCGLAVIEHGAAAEDAILIGPAGSGGERDGLVLPVNHVVAGGVRPVHVAPDGGLRVVLVEHVIAAAVENGTVGIVHPVVSGEKMILRAERIGGELTAEL